MAVNIGMKYFENILVNEEYLVYFQQQNAKEWYTPVRGFTAKESSIWVVDQGDTMQTPKCNRKVVQGRWD